MRNTPDLNNTSNSFHAVEPTIRAAASRFANRFAIEQLREEIEAESVARVLALIAAQRPPFDLIPDREAVHRMQRFTHGLVANVAREALRGRVRHAHAPLDGRATACRALRVGQRAPGANIELEESISEALRRFRSLSAEIRETIVAEQIMQNQYTGGEAGRLCRSCEVSFQRVWKMITDRKSGAWSGEAWRQRVHRSRKKARAAIGAATLFTLAMTLSLGLSPSNRLPHATNVEAPAVASPESDLSPSQRVADDGSTQNGRQKRATLASTQNGKAKKKASA